MKIEDKYIHHYTVCGEFISNPITGKDYINKDVIGYILKEDSENTEVFGWESKNPKISIIQGVLTQINLNKNKPFLVKDDSFEYDCNYVRLVNFPHLEAENFIDYVSSLDSNISFNLENLTWQEVLNTLLTKSTTFLRKPLKSN